MKKYIIPATICQPLVSGTFVCQLTSLGSGEAQEDVQLAPTKKGWLY